MRRRVYGVLIVSALGLSAASAADIAQPVDANVCGNGTLAIQVDQILEKRESYDFANRRFSPFSPRYSQGMRTTSVTRRTHGEARTTVPLSLDGRRVHGSGIMAMEADDHIRTRGASCSRKRTFTLNWTFDGLISDQCSIDLTVVRDWTEQPEAHGCEADILGLFGNYPQFSQTWSASLTAARGASVKRESGDYSSKDITALTVVSTTQPQ